MDEEPSCYGGGAIAATIFGTLLCGAVLAYVLWLLYKRYQKNSKGQHLVVEDPENAKTDFAFDNHAFKSDHNKTNPLDTKWNSKQNTTAMDNRKTVDDTHAGTPTPRLISLRGSDFTGLGIEVCGGLKDGIFVKKVMPQGPAANIINIGDKISSITIDFRHIVQEDAATILSYASPYNVQLELLDGKGTLPIFTGSNSPSAVGQTSLTHPLYRSSSQEDFNTIERNARKKLFPNDDRNYPTLKMEQPKQSSNKNLATVHKENEKKNISMKQQFKDLIDEKFQTKSDNKEPVPAARRSASPEDSKKGLKFGVRVLPLNLNDKIIGGGKSPSKNENENNVNIEKTVENQSATHVANAEVALSVPPPISKRTKHKVDDKPATNDNATVTHNEFQRQGSVTSSGIRRDANGIPQEIPNQMMQAAMAARDNRKSSGNLLDKAGNKGKAPIPPPASYLDNDLNASTDTVDTQLSASLNDTSVLCNGSINTKDQLNFTDNFNPHDIIENGDKDEIDNKSKNERELNGSDTESQMADQNGHESDNEYSTRNGTQIELNSNHITIHQTSNKDDIEDEIRQTASLGDLSQFDNNSSGGAGGSVNGGGGTLERAQSLDITDGSLLSTKLTPKKRKAPKNEIDTSIEFKEPRLMDNTLSSNNHLDTIQRGRLKSAHEWGNLEDAILNNTSDDESIASDSNLNQTIHFVPQSFGDDDDDKRSNDFKNKTKTYGHQIGNGVSDHEIDRMLTKKTNGIRVSPTVELTSAANLEDTLKKFIETERSVLFESTAAPQLHSVSNAEPSSNYNNNYSYKGTISPINFQSKIIQNDHVTNGHDNDEHHNDNQQQQSIENEPDQVKIINYGTNMPDDVKVSRYPFESLDRPKSDIMKKVAQQISSIEDATAPILMNGKATSSTSKTTIKPSNSSPPNEPISLTLTGYVENDMTESSQISPVYSSDGHGVNSISISSMEVNIRPDSRKDNIGDATAILGFENILTINTADDDDIAASSQPSSIILIDDEKLDFTLQTLDEDKKFATSALPSKNEVFIIESLSSKKMSESVPSKDNESTYVTEINVQQQIAQNEINNKNNNYEKSTQITKTIDPNELEALIAAALKNDDIALTAGIKSKSDNSYQTYTDQEKQNNESEYIPRNSQIKFTTSTYESPIVPHIEKRHSHIDQIRSNFEKNHNSEIPVPIRKTSIPTTPTHNTSTRISPSKIPVFNSSSTSRMSMSSSSSNGSTTDLSIVNNKNNNNNNHNGSNSALNKPLTVSVTSIKNSSRNPSGK